MSLKRDGEWRLLARQVVIARFGVLGHVAIMRRFSDGRKRREILTSGITLHRLQCEFMPSYRIYHMKDSLRQQFRWAPHVSGNATVKPKDYEQNGHIEAQNEYDAWRLLRESDKPLGVGDLLESEEGRLHICKYVGFEPAQWVLPEPAGVA